MIDDWKEGLALAACILALCLGIGGCDYLGSLARLNKMKADQIQKQMETK